MSNETSTTLIEQSQKQTRALRKSVKPRSRDEIALALAVLNGEVQLQSILPVIGKKNNGSAVVWVYTTLAWAMRNKKITITEAPIVPAAEGTDKISESVPM